MRFNLTSIFLFISVCLSAQKMQWASELREFSSEKGKKQFSANQVLGRPDVLPLSGSNPGAWQPAKDQNSKTEFIRVRFAKPIFARQVVICENLNPGAIRRITLINTAKGKVLAYTNKNPKHAGVRKRVFSVVLSKTTKTKIQEVLVELNTANVKGGNGIDAIGISEDETELKEISVNVLDQAFLGKD